MFNINKLNSNFTRISLFLTLTWLLWGCVKNAAMPDYPSESGVRAAFARIAIDLAERFGEHPASQWQLWLKPARNDADNWLRGENGALVSFELDALASQLGQMLCSPEVFQATLKQLRVSSPQSWRRLCDLLGVECETYNPPTPAQPLFAGLGLKASGQCRVTLSVSCHYETEHLDRNHLRNHLIVEVRIVDLETAEELYRRTERIDQFWQRNWL